MAKSFEEWFEKWYESRSFSTTSEAARAGFDAGRAAVLDSGGELPERPGRLEPIITGKRVKSVAYGIKAASDYTAAAEAYMDAANAEIARLRALLAAPPTPPEETL